MNKQHILGFFDDLVRTPVFLFLCAMFLCGAAAGGLTGLRAGEGDGAAVLWQNKLNREEHLLSMDVTFFVRKEDGCYRRFREQHHQRAHSADELTAWLCQSGFEDVRIYGEMRMDATKPEDLRMHITAKKPE